MEPETRAKHPGSTLHHTSEGQRRSGRFEHLVVHGLLRADLTFEPLAFRSTFSLRPMRTPVSAGYLLELRDEKGTPLQRAPVAVFDPVVCHDQESDAKLVHGRIALRPGAARVVLFKDEILVHEQTILDPPSLSLVWKPKAVRRDETYTLGFEFSEPAPDAYLVVYFQWGDRAYRAIGLLRPQKDMRVGFGSVPGGDACRLIAAYSDGLRTAVAVTGPFTVPPLAPRGQILAPVEGWKTAAGHPVTLSGQSLAGASWAGERDDLIWRIAGREVGRGRTVTVAGLPAGRHTVELGIGDGQVLDRRELMVV